jgi:hypothetical protein
MLVALAGPVSNFLMALAAAGLFRLGLFSFDAGETPDRRPAVLANFCLDQYQLDAVQLNPIAAIGWPPYFEFFLPAAWLRAIEPIWSAGLSSSCCLFLPAICDDPYSLLIIGPPRRL